MNSVSERLKYQVAIQGPDNRGAVLRLVSRMVLLSQPSSFVGTFAYATRKGVELLCQALVRATPDWSNASKTWIVSVDFGYTEPEAISVLMALPHSQVRIPYATEVIRRNLRPQFAFHGKSIVFHRGDTLEAGGGMVIASANMTVSGLCFGHEHASGYIWRHRRYVPQSTWNTLEAAFRQISELYDASETPTDALLADYVARRPQRLILQSEDTTDEVEKISSQDADLSLYENATLATSGSLWVDVDYVVENRGEGRPGNQIDLQNGTRVFFGLPSVQVPRNTLLGEIVIEYRTRHSPCNIRFGNNQMDKLNLPIPGDGGPTEYAGKTLLFTRRAGNVFRLSLRSRNGSKHWKELSRKQNSLFEMRSGRQYGVFS